MNAELELGLRALRHRAQVGEEGAAAVLRHIAELEGDLAYAVSVLEAECSAPEPLRLDGQRCDYSDGGGVRLGGAMSTRPGSYDDYAGQVRQIVDLQTRVYDLAGRIHSLLGQIAHLQGVLRSIEEISRSTNDARDPWARHARIHMLALRALGQGSGEPAGTAACAADCTETVTGYCDG